MLANALKNTCKVRTYCYDMYVICAVFVVCMDEYYNNILGYTNNAESIFSFRNSRGWSVYFTSYSTQILCKQHWIHSFLRRVRCKFLLHAFISNPLSKKKYIYFDSAIGRLNLETIYLNWNVSKLSEAFNFLDRNQINIGVKQDS